MSLEKVPDSLCPDVPWALGSTAHARLKNADVSREQAAILWPRDLQKYEDLAEAVDMRVAVLDFLLGCRRVESELGRHGSDGDVARDDIAVPRWTVSVNIRS